MTYCIHLCTDKWAKITCKKCVANQEKRDKMKLKKQLEAYPFFGRSRKI